MIFDTVKSMIAKQLKVDEASITPESRLIEDLKADSANVMMLIMDLETEFNITVDDEILATIKTVGDIVDYLEKNTK